MKIKIDSCAIGDNEPTFAMTESGSEHDRNFSITKKMSGSVMIFDEITSGWRLTVGDAHASYNVNPDIAHIIHSGNVGSWVSGIQECICIILS